MNKTKKQKEKREERRQFALAYLGGKCIECGSTLNLEFHHIDKTTKKNNISSLYSSSLKILKEELDKCELLCDKHHNDKTLEEKKQIRAEGTHGTLSSYRYCHCSICKEARNVYNRKYHGWVVRVPAQHGTYSKYKNGCRCNECKSANNSYMKNYYANKALLT
jgi:hypothetical protein